MSTRKPIDLNGEMDDRLLNHVIGLSAIFRLRWRTN